MLKRIKWLDFAKGITILDVLLIHTSHFVMSSNSIYINKFFKFFNFILCIPAMPIFFAISGYLYRPTNTLHKYKILLYKKSVSFVIPYICFSFVLIMQGLIRHKTFIQIFSGHVFWPMGYLWFLYTLFFIFILVGLFDLLHINLITQVCLAILVMFIQMIIWSSNSPFSPLSCVGSYMICFYLGYIIKRWNLILYLKKHLMNIYLIILWLILIIINYYIFGTKYTFDLLTYQDCVIKLISIIVFFSFFASFCSTNKFFHYFDKYGHYTLIIYLIHVPIINILHLLLKKFIYGTNISVIVFIVISVAGWYISTYVCYLVTRYNIINFIFYPRKYINKFLLKYL